MANLAVSRESIMQTMFAYDLRPAKPKDEGLFVEWAEATLAFSQKPAPTISFDEQVFLPSLLNLTTGSFDVVLVDEAQDLNACQYRLALNAVKPGGRVIAVGDDRQAIYAFRGADSDAIGRMTRDLKAAVLPLSITYRCPQAVVRLAQRLVPDFEAGEGAPEGRVKIVNEKEFLGAVQAGDAVISRTNAALTKYCMTMLAAGKRARIVGRDLGAKLESILSRAHSSEIKAALSEMSAYVEDESERLVAAKKDDKAEELLDNMEAIRAISEGLASVDRLRSKINALFADSDEGVDYGTIPCMTVHKAKGLEFDKVWMLESTFRINHTEGENLYYVAVTRAKKHLFLVQIPRSDGKEIPSIARSQLGYE
jgi:DNA helicase-2/ATP-dependent DNA helicase PcrA